MIYLINQHKKSNLEYSIFTIPIDRTSILGNPFIMSKYKNQEEERNRVCDEYQKYFDTIISAYKKSLENPYINRISNEYMLFIDELYRIYALHKVHEIYLSCWCKPKRCHGETIKYFLENDAKEIFEEREYIQRCGSILQDGIHLPEKLEIEREKRKEQFLKAVFRRKNK